MLRSKPHLLHPLGLVIYWSSRNKKVSILLSPNKREGFDGDTHGAVTRKGDQKEGIEYK